MKNVQRGFSDLIKTYRLQVVDRIETQNLPVSPLADAPEDGKKKFKNKKKSTKLIKVEKKNLAPPGWCGACVSLAIEGRKGRSSLALPCCCVVRRACREY